MEEALLSDFCWMNKCVQAQLRSCQGLCVDLTAAEL